MCFKKIKDEIRMMNSNNEKILQQKQTLLEKIENLEKETYNFKRDLKIANKKENNKDKFINKTISEIPHFKSKDLYGKVILIQEKTTKKKFEVRVSDYCDENHKGFIVSFKTKDTNKLNGLIRKYNIQQDDNCYRTLPNKAVDLRNRFSAGDGWTYLGVIK